MIPDRFAPLQARAARDPLLSRLVTEGFAILPRATEPERILAASAALDERFERTPFSVGPFHGERTKRFHRLLARCSEAPALAMHPQILEATRTILGLWCDFPEVNLTQGVEIHPGAPAQIPHADQAMWPVPKGAMELCVNVFWPLGPFTTANGATRVWPRSHFRPRNPEDPLPEPDICEMSPGDAFVILGSTVHAAGANRTRRPRRALIFSYCLGWLKAYENQSLAYSAEFANSLDPELAAMLGFRWHRPNLGTYDGQCPSILLRGKAPDHLATVDALSPEHEALVSRFAEAQVPKAA